MCSHASTHTHTSRHTHTPPPRQQKGELVDGRLAFHSVRLSRLQLHHLVLEGGGDVLEHPDRYAQRQVDALVERVQLLAVYALLVQPVEEVADLGQAEYQQEQVPGEHIQAAHGHPAPQGQTYEAQAQEAEDEEAAVGTTASHVAQEQDGAAQVVDGPLHVATPAIAERGEQQAVQQSGVVCAHGRHLHQIMGLEKLIIY